MITIPTCSMTLNLGDKTNKLEIHNWCQEIVLRNKDGKCLAFSDGSEKSFTKLLSYFNELDREMITSVVLNIADTEMSNRILEWNLSVDNL